MPISFTVYNCRHYFSAILTLVKVPENYHALAKLTAAFKLVVIIHLPSAKNLSFLSNEKYS